MAEITITKENFEKAYMCKVLSVLKKYYDEKIEDNAVKAEEDMQNFEETEEDTEKFNWISFIYSFVCDYLQNGLYSDSEFIEELNGEGEINWDRTINETNAFIQKGKPIYIDTYNIESHFEEYNYFRRIHQCILSECSEVLEKIGFSFFFDVPYLSFDEEKLESIGTNEEILYQINTELRNQFVTRKQLLLQKFKQYIESKRTSVSLFDEYMYGTRKYENVWEKVCSRVFNDVKDIYEDINKIVSDFEKYNLDDRK